MLWQIVITAIYVWGLVFAVETTSVCVDADGNSNGLCEDFPTTSNDTPSSLLTAAKIPKGANSAGRPEEAPVDCVDRFEHCASWSEARVPVESRLDVCFLLVELQCLSSS